MIMLVTRLSLQSLCQDILSYQRVIDGVLDKAQPLAKTDPDISSAIGQINDRYSQLCTTAKVSTDSAAQRPSQFLLSLHCLGHSSVWTEL